MNQCRYYLKNKKNYLRSLLRNEQLRNHTITFQVESKLYQETEHIKYNHFEIIRLIKISYKKCSS